MRRLRFRTAPHGGNSSDAVSTSTRSDSGAGRSFVWTLEAWQAEMSAEDVGDLVRPGCRSGSAVLEAARGEIPVKISLGEYADDFLTAKAPG